MVFCKTHVNHSPTSLKGVNIGIIEGVTIRVTNGDTRSLVFGSLISSVILLGSTTTKNTPSDSYQRARENELQKKSRTSKRSFLPRNKLHRV